MNLSKINDMVKCKQKIIKSLLYKINSYKVNFVWVLPHWYNYNMWYNIRGSDSSYRGTNVRKLEGRMELIAI